MNLAAEIDARLYYEDGEIKRKLTKGGRAAGASATYYNHNHKYVKIKRKIIKAAKVSWYLNKGEFPKRELVYLDGNSRNIKIENLGLMTEEEFWLRQKGAYLESNKEISSHVSSIYCSYKDGAKKRGIPFKLNKKEVFDFCTLPCHYCNVVGSCSSKRPGNPIEFRYNGIDRMNNKVGYLEGNCVACCIVCNRAKSDMQYMDFIAWVTNMRNSSSYWIPADSARI